MDLIGLLPLLVALATALVITPIVRLVAIRFGMVAQPKSDRWHSKPTALLGGIAIALSVAITWLLFASRMPQAREGWIVLVASLFLGLVGLVDDVLQVKPYQKLIGQVMGAAMVLSTGLALHWTGWPMVNIAITFFWLIGITNAINLLDNMDGLAAGVSAIAAAFLAIHLQVNGQPQEALMLGVCALTLVGFLVYNSTPASVFMGDTGSMFVGFFLASSVLLSGNVDRTRSYIVVVAVPVLVLFIPIFDTTLVTIVRKVSGRAASQGGRDHTSHRLVALGLSERRTVWLLYALAIGSGLLAVLVNRLDYGASVALILAFMVGLSLLGVYLARVRVYDEAEVRAARERPLIAFIADISYKRRLFEVLLDLVLIILAFYSANVLLRVTIAPGATWDHFLTATAVLVFMQMFAMLAMGSYRGLWRYASIENGMVYAQGILLGTALGFVALRFVLRLADTGPSLFVLDAVLLFVMVAFSRVTFRIFRYLLPMPPSADARRVVIFGAGDGGEMLLRELRNNPVHGLNPVAFVDDDQLKTGKKIHGLQIHHANRGGLIDVCRAHTADEVVVSTANIPDDRLAEVVRACNEGGIVLRRMRIQLEIVPPSKPVLEGSTGRRQSGGHEISGVETLAGAVSLRVGHRSS